MDKITGFIITAGHLDIEWYQPLRSYRFWTVQALEDLKEAARRPDFVTYVLDGQVYPLDEYLDVLPGDEPEMRELIRQGKLAIGPFYTQFDEWLPSAENMIRNCLYGKRGAKAYGGYMSAGYLPDNFGHPAQMPQILQGFGIDSLMFMRGMPEIAGGHPDEFIYEGLDGSRVLVSHFRESYSGAFDIFDKNIDPIQPRETPYYNDYLSFEYHRELADHDDPARIARNMVQNVHKIKNRYPSGVIPLIAGYDHLPPQINIGDSVKAANGLQDDIEFVMGSVEDYVRAVQARIKDPAVYNMELIGSKYQYVLLGALSTRTYLKRQNFACEALLERYAEPLDVIAAEQGYPDKPTLFDEAWKLMLLNSAHDSIHGSSVDEVHVEMESRYAAVRQIASGVIHDALAYMGARAERWWESSAVSFAPVTATFAQNGGHLLPITSKGILAYAPVRAPFPQSVEVWLPMGEESVCVYSREGEKLPTQVVARESAELNGIGKPRNDMFPAPVFKKVLFMDSFADGTVDSFAARPGEQGGFESISAGDNFLENGLIRVETSGALLHITDKATGKTYYNLNLLEEDADAGDSWDFAPPWVPGEIARSSSFPFSSRLVECGPVRAALEVRGEMDVPACLHGDLRSGERARIPVVFRVVLWRGIRRVDVKLRFENNAKDHRLRLRLPSGLKTDTILSQGPLAVMERPIACVREIEPWRQPPTQLMPCREWIAATDGKDGLAIALKGLYDYEAVINPLNNEPDVFITLLRGFELMGRLNTLQRDGAASEAFDTPGAQCLGMQEIEWSYIPYAADPTDKAPFLPLAQGFLYPPVSHAVRGKAEGMHIPALPPLARWTESNLQFSALKRGFDREGAILRVYENQGIPVRARLEISFRRAWLVRMDEEVIRELPVEDGTVTVDVGAYQAVTLKLL